MSPSPLRFSFTQGSHFSTHQAFPLDAGTDNGFTFTSPNWETEPRGEVTYVNITPTQITRTLTVAIFYFISKPS